jgi:AcrR family transcriptional regulator
MSSQTITQNQLTDRILVAARNLLAANPNAAFTMNQLAEESGVSRATLYRYMGSREALLRRLAVEQNIDIKELDAPNMAERILKATRSALGQAGSINFTIEQVAEEAGIGVATVYRHYGSKAEILKALSNSFHPKRAAFNHLEQATGDLETDLRRFTMTALVFMYENRDLAPFYFSNNPQIQGMFISLGDDQNRTLDMLSSYFDKQIQAGSIPPQSSYDLATAFLGMVVAFAFIKPRYTNEIDDPERVAKLVTHLFLDGICREEKDSQ